MLLYDKFKNAKTSDKARLHKLKCKLEITRPYLNAPIFPKFTKKHLNFEILQTHP